METLLTNSITLYLRWLFTKIALGIKYWGKHLHLEYMAEVKNTKFGVYNSVYKYSRLRHSELGDFSYIARNSQIQYTKIGKFCCIGPNVNTGLGSHPTSEFVSSHPLFYSTKGQLSGLSIVDKDLFEEYLETSIGHDVWIGANVIIKSGVTIGNGAIIAAGAIVSKNVDPFSVVGGVPAKHIKFRFTPEQISFLQEFKWWNKDLNWIKENKELFVNIDKLMEQYQVKTEDKTHPSL